MRYPSVRPSSLSAVCLGASHLSLCQNVVPIRQGCRRFCHAGPRDVQLRLHVVNLRWDLGTARSTASCYVVKIPVHLQDRTSRGCHSPATPTSVPPRIGWEREVEMSALSQSRQTQRCWKAAARALSQTFSLEPDLNERDGLHRRSGRAGTTAWRG